MRKAFSIVFLSLCLHLSAGAQTWTYSTWIAQYPSLTGSDALPAAQPLKDGIPNLVKYVLYGVDPTVPLVSATSRDPLPTQRWQTDVSGSFSAVTTTTTVSGTSTRAHGVLRWRPRTGVSDYRVIPMGTNDLQHWFWGDSGCVIFTDGTYNYARTKSNFLVWKKVFMRLEIEPIP